MTLPGESDGDQDAPRAERVRVPLRHGGPSASLGALLERPAGATPPVALVAHGRGGAAGQPQIAAIRAAYARRGWATLTPDLRFSAGNQSGGAPEAFTMANHLADLRAALDWLCESFEPGGGPARLGFAGHSMGAWAAATLARDFGGAAHLLAVSPVLSGEALLAARRALGRDAVAALRREVPGAEAEWPGHDARPALRALTAPTAVLVGGEDGLTPPQDARAFFAAAAAPRFFAALPGLHHCPEGPDVDRALDVALAALGA
ncbi:dienelactone hydrolase family protein [Rubrimonas cliftonensis]|uniref:Uncharacterized protein n=1 Tax=Rubrimonas cliftonensis TaxID=89524 RepID=A0A1H4CM79_9RHOB|nr:dienelactone hydrolase family protein [Rubrimonas cliftonensis]SEA61429.1 hypothetical protein SAMN05444370_107142 [Rubrimonas cliftonensis]